MARKPKTNVNQMVTRDGKQYRPRTDTGNYQACLSTIRQWVGGWPKVAAALEQIRDDHLWLDGGYKTWVAFLDAEFPINKSQAYDILRAAKPLRLLAAEDSGIRNDPPPVSQMSDLGRLPEDQIVDSWVEINETEGDVTAEKVRAYVDQKVAKPGQQLTKGEKAVKRKPAQRAVCPTCSGEGYLDSSGGAFG